MWTCGHFEGVKHARGRATPSWLRETRTLVASFSTAAMLAISLTPAPVALGVSTTAAPRPRARREGDMREERVSSTQRRSDCTTRRNSKHRLASDVRGLACSPWDTVSVGGFDFILARCSSPCGCERRWGGLPRWPYALASTLACSSALPQRRRSTRRVRETPARAACVFPPALGRQMATSDHPIVTWIVTRVSGRVVRRWHRCIRMSAQAGGC